MSVSWNLWHGCRKISEGCRHCYVYRRDSLYGKDSSVVARTAAFDLPVKRKRNGDYRVPSGEQVYTCFTSDFFLAEADEWRSEAWDMIRERSDLSFVIPTKRINRFGVALPADWGDGYPHVAIACTIENQEQLDRRLPIFKALPIASLLRTIVGPARFSRLARPRHRRGVGRRRVGQRGAGVRLRLGARYSQTMCRAGNPVQFSSNGCPIAQRRSHLPHSPRVPAHAGPAGWHRL